ncbi:hypothetical protein [Priestia megaterium]|uniref:hypothetical protein n=1 Tax=Priestia megaterium TaxID=1404 RepID=UPI000BF7B657|nr:hypothetical protein [Priestia megaterium]PFK78942.1 hypothetical protein COJ21_04035 [Priestia megaterium]
MKFFYISIILTFYFFPYVLSDHAIFTTLNHKFPIVYLLILFVTVVLLFIKKIKLRISTQHKLFLSLTGLVYVFFPLISYNILNFDFYSNVNNVIQDFIFIIVITIISAHIKFEKDLYKVMGAIAIGNGLFIVPSILINLAELFNMNNYMWLIDGERVIRATYEMRHPNFTGMTILIEVFSVLICFIVLKRLLYKLGLIFLEVILIAALITTGNRAAFYALVLSIIIGLFIFVLKKLKRLARNLVIVYSFLIVSIFFLFFFDWNKFYSSSDSLIERFQIMNRVFVLIPKYGDYFFGIAPINQIKLAQELIFLRNDNWFVQEIVLYGFVGLILLLILIIYLIVVNIKQYFITNSIYNLIKLVVLSAGIIYSTMEITLFAHGYSWSLFIWIVILTRLKEECQEKTVKKV